MILSRPWPGMSTSVSRGIDRRLFAPPPMRMSMIESERPAGRLRAGLARVLRALVGAEHEHVVRRPQRVAGAAEALVGRVGDLALLDLRADEEQHERQRDPDRDRARAPSARCASPTSRAAARARRRGRCGRRAAWRARRRRRARAAEARPCASGRRGTRAGPRDPWVAACSRVWWPIVSTGCVIGVDLGGTKLLAGAVDPASTSIIVRPVRRAARTRQAILEPIVAAVRESATRSRRRRAPSRRSASGSPA